MKKSIIAPLVATAIALASASADAIPVSSSTEASINDGAFIDGTVMDAQSAFSQQFAISSNSTSYMGMTYFFGTIALSDVPVNNGKFTFTYDAQETGRSPTLDIPDIVLVADGNEIWNLGPVLELDGSTATLSNNADFALSVPLALFDGYGLTGASILEFYWKQEGDSNGPDEWVTVGDGFFGPGEPIVTPMPAPVPVTPTLPLVAIGLALAALTRRGKG